ncbi:MAG: hypothetical protein ACTHU7_00895, partial [Microbacterium sp.]
MNQYGTQLQEQWMTLDPDRAEAMGPEYFARQGQLARQQITTLIPKLMTPSGQDETYLETVGRVTNARMRAEEIVMRAMPRPTGPDDWEDRFDAWQASHPVWATLAEFQETMSDLDDESMQNQSEAERLATSVRMDVRDELESIGLTAELIEECLTPST